MVGVGVRWAGDRLVAGLKPEACDFELLFGRADHRVQPLGLRLAGSGCEVRRRDDQRARLFERVGDWKRTTSMSTRLASSRNGRETALAAGKAISPTARRRRASSCRRLPSACSDPRPAQIQPGHSLARLRLGIGECEAGQQLHGSSARHRPPTCRRRDEARRDPVDAIATWRQDPKAVPANIVARRGCGGPLACITRIRAAVVRNAVKRRRRHRRRCVHPIAEHSQFGKTRGASGPIVSFFTKK